MMSLVASVMAKVAAMQAPVVVAASGGGGGDLTSAVSTLTNMATSVLTLITGNPILLVFFCAPILGVVIVVVKKLRS